MPSSGDQSVFGEASPPYTASNPGTIVAQSNRTATNSRAAWPSAARCAGSRSSATTTRAKPAGASAMSSSRPGVAPSPSVAEGRKLAVVPVLQEVNNDRTTYLGRACRGSDTAF